MRVEKKRKKVQRVEDCGCRPSDVTAKLAAAPQVNSVPSLLDMGTMNHWLDIGTINPLCVPNLLGIRTIDPRRG